MNEYWNGSHTVSRRRQGLDPDPEIVGSTISMQYIHNIYSWGIAQQQQHTVQVPYMFPAGSTCRQVVERFSCCTSILVE